MAYYSLNFYPKNTQNLDQKVNQQQNTVCLNQQIYASPHDFTPTLLVMLETFRRSAPYETFDNGEIWKGRRNIGESMLLPFILCWNSILDKSGEQNFLYIVGILFTLHLAFWMQQHWICPAIYSVWCFARL